MKTKSIPCIITHIIEITNKLAAILLFASFISCTTKGRGINNPNRIIVEATISKYFYSELQEIFEFKDEIRLRYIPIHYNPLDPGGDFVSGKVVNEKVIWTLYSDKPIRVSPPFGTTIVMKPGDSVHISYLSDIPVYSGNNKIGLTLLDTLMLLETRLLKPHKKYSYNATTLTDFLEWNHYLDHRLALQLPAIEFYKDKISLFEYDYYKVHTIGKIEYDRIEAFTALYSSVQEGNSDLSFTNLLQIWDTTQYKQSRQWLQSFTAYNGSVGDIYSFLQMKTLRKFGFDSKNDSIKSHESFIWLLYNSAKKEYKGLMRERLMAYVLDEPTITEMGLKNPMTQLLLKDYYNQPGYPEYKQWVKTLEKKQLEKERKNEKS